MGWGGHQGCARVLRARERVFYGGPSATCNSHMTCEEVGPPSGCRGRGLNPADPEHGGPHRQRGSAASYLSPSAGLLIGPQHLSEGGGGAVAPPGLPLKTHGNTFISQRHVLHTFSLLLYILLPLSAPPTLIATLSPPPLSLHLCFSLGLIIWRSSLSQSQTEPATTGEQWWERSRCNYNVPSAAATAAPSPIPLSRCIGASDRRQLLSRLPSQPPKYKPWIQPQWASCLAAIAPSSRGGLSLRRIANRWGG